MLDDLKLDKAHDGFLFLAESARNPPTLPPHHHVELELNLVMRGAISYVVEGQRITFERGRLLWLFPAQEHQLVDRSRDALNYVVVFKPGLIARSCRTSSYAGLKGARPNGPGVLHTHLESETLDLLGRTMGSLLLGAPDADTLNRESGFGSKSSFRFQHSDPERLNAGLHFLLLECWRLQCAGPSAAAAVSLHPAVEKALDLLTHDSEGMDLPTLARRSGASAAHLSRMFALQVGVPISRYRNSIRLGKFFDHFRATPQRTMAEAMYAAGFGSYAQFHRVFTQAYGHGPRASFHPRR